MVKTFIFIAGAPGSGKSTVAANLQKKLNTPLFEFGWIPEFRFNGSQATTYTEDEVLAFENLTLVLKNYAKHGFRNVIVTDLENRRIAQLNEQFEDFDYIIVTLRILNDELLKGWVLNESRSSQYRDWEAARAINQELLRREPFQNEVFVDIEDQRAEDTAGLILGLIS